MPKLQPQDQLLARIRQIWESAGTQAVRSVNTAHVCANWPIGQQIVQAEQGGQRRAGYGKALLKTLSVQLASEYGSGFSVSALQYMRGFFLGYADLLANQHAVRVEFAASPTQHAARGELADNPAWRAGTLHPGLSWTHYRILPKVDRRAVRDFYEIEAIRNGWSARQLERQIASLLFERLSKSRDKKGVLAQDTPGQPAPATQALTAAQRQQAYRQRSKRAVTKAIGAEAHASRVTLLAVLGRDLALLGDETASSMHSAAGRGLRSDN